MKSTAQNCCAPKEAKTNAPEANRCPESNTKGKQVQLSTLKSLLTPPALAKFQPNEIHFFCPKDDCSTVYFGGGSTYHTTDVKVPVYQKDPHMDVHVCYCFGWTRQAIANTAARGEEASILPSISAHVKAGRCGCELNNPQGSCCLGSVQAEISKRKHVLDAR